MGIRKPVVSAAAGTLTYRCISPWTVSVQLKGIPRVYEEGPESSIVYRNPCSKRWRFLHDANPSFHPVNFYEHHPNISIAYVYLSRTGKIVARCLVYQKGSVKEFGSIYATTRFFEEMLKRALIDEFDCKVQSTYWKSDFILPMDFIEQMHVIPLPFFDNLDGVYLLPDTATKTCLVSSDVASGGTFYNGLSHVGYAAVRKA